MRIFFDDGKFVEDLEKVIAPLDKYNAPLVVVATEKDAERAKNAFGDDEHITFISFDYWYSKKWLADNDYDHIDFFRLDKALAFKSFGIKVGCATIKRMIAKVENNVKEEDTCSEE